MFVSCPASLIKFFIHIIDLFIACVDGYKEKDAFFTLSGTIKDVDIFWNSVINENVTSIYVLTGPNFGNSLIFPEESGEIKLEATNIKRVVSFKRLEASRTKSRVKRYTINGKKVLNMHCFVFNFTVFFLFCFVLFCFFFVFFELETNSLYNDTDVTNQRELLHTFYGR